MSWLFDKMLTLSNKKSTFVLVSDFFDRWVESMDLWMKDHGSCLNLLFVGL